MATERIGFSGRTRLGNTVALTVDATVKSLPSIPSGCARAWLSVEAQPIRFTMGGTDPSATYGHLAPAGTFMELPDATTIGALRVTRQGGTDATIHVTYYT